METPFEIGSKYWLPRLQPHQVEVPCPVCYGNRTVTVTLGNGEHVAVSCEGCGLGFAGPRGFITEYSYDASITPFTIEKVTSMHGETWYLQSFEGDTAAWSELCKTKEEAELASRKRMSEIIEENAKRHSAKRKGDLKKFPWTVRYHEERIRNYEKQIAWHRSKVSERMSKVR